MKAWTMVCTLAAVAFASTTHVAVAEDCPDLIKIFDIVKPLEADENVKKCIAATGFELLPPPGPPTKEQVAKLCAQESCKNVFASLQKLNIPDCNISILGGVNLKKVIGEAFGQCSAAAPAPAPASSAAPAPTSAAPAATPTVTPAKPASPAPAPSAAPAAPAAPSTAAATPAPAPAAKVPGPAPAPTPAGSSTKATGKTKNCHA